MHSRVRIDHPTVQAPRVTRPLPIDELRGGFLSITTYRRDGTAVSTPVWFVVEGNTVLVQTDASSGKVKRIRRSPNAVIARCSARGRITGPAFEASATILAPSELERVRALIARKYRVAMLFFRPIRAIQTRLHPERREEVALAFTVR